MSQIIKKTPIPIAGLMLAFATTGNLIGSYGLIYKNTLGIISLLLFILITLKLMFHPKLVMDKMNNPLVASVSPTYSMGAMLLSTYIKPYNLPLASLLWGSGLVLHVSLMFWFTHKFLFNFEIEKVFPSYFIVYVGLVMTSITSPAFGYVKLGQSLFWFGFVSYLVLLPIVIYRLIKHPNLPTPTLPSIAILAAPASLCLAGYMSSFEVRNSSVFLLLSFLSILMYFGVLSYMPKLLKLPFFPSFSAFTFPLAISGVAIKKASSGLVELGLSQNLMQTLVHFQEGVTLCTIFYVLLKYIQCHYLQNNSAVLAEGK